MENIGTAMKTIIARFTELKTNVAGTADSEFEDLDYKKKKKKSLKDVQKHNQITFYSLFRLTSYFLQSKHRFYH